MEFLHFCCQPEEVPWSINSLLILNLANIFPQCHLTGRLTVLNCNLYFWCSHTHQIWVLCLWVLLRNLLQTPEPQKYPKYFSIRFIYFPFIFRSLIHLKFIFCIVRQESNFFFPTVSHFFQHHPLNYPSSPPVFGKKLYYIPVSHRYMVQCLGSLFYLFGSWPVPAPLPLTKLWQFWNTSQSMYFLKWSYSSRLGIYIIS